MIIPLLFAAIIRRFSAGESHRLSGGFPSR
jgi:hypothetical protein